MILTRARRRASVLPLAILISVGAGAIAFAQKAGPPTAAPRAAAAAPAAASLETLDPALASAILRLRAARSSENLATVADRYYQLGIRDKAMDYYTESLQRDPACARSLDGAARVWRDWGQLDRALGSAHRASYFAPRSAGVWNTLGTVLQALGHDALAADAYGKAISLDGGAAYARSNLCYLAFAGGDIDRAIAECTAALQVDGQFRPALNNLALAYAAAGDTQRASETFAAATGEAAGHYNTGLVLLAQREYPAAVVAFEAAYRLEPSFDAAHARARDARRLARHAMETRDVHR